MSTGSDRADSAARITGLRRGVEARGGRASSPPAGWELLVVHVLYWLSGVLVVRSLVAFLGSGRRIGAGALEEILAMAALCALLMLWAGLRRMPLAEKWFVSHLLWLSVTYAVAGGAFAGSLLLLAVAMIFALLLPPLVFLLHAPAVMAWVFAAWFTWRIGRGYLAFIRRAPAGQLAGA